MINVSIRVLYVFAKNLGMYFFFSFFIAGLVRPEYNWIGQNGGDGDSWKH